VQLHRFDFDTDFDTDADFDFMPGRHSGVIPFSV